MIDRGGDDRRRWYVVQTKPKQEARADANLRRWNVETLAPSVREYRRLASASAPRVAPLFPNYLFARFEVDTMAGKIRLTRGVQRIVGFGEYATPVEDAVIDLIRSRIGDDGLVRVPELQPGDVVEVVDGPLRSLVGVFERHVNARDRVIILLSTIGRGARVQLATTAVRNLTQSVA
jgi:transcriptional antiterminator RfaH